MKCTIQNAVAPVIESLETRKMLSATPVTYNINVWQPDVDNGAVHRTLDINGTKKANTFKVSIAEASEKTVNVTIFNGKKSKTIFDINHVNINTYRGNDNVTITGPGLSENTHFVYINTGDGNDKINVVNFEGGLQANGGDGNDTVDFSKAIDDDAILGTNRWLSAYGDEGDDVLIGSIMDDGLYGGAGNDTIRGGDGDDIIDGGAGTNMLYGDDGDDQFYSYPVNSPNPWNQGGVNKIDGGSGHDIVRLINNTNGTAEFSNTTINTEDHTVWFWSDSDKG